MDNRKQLQQLFKTIIIIIMFIIIFYPLWGEEYPKPILHICPFIATSMLITPALGDNSIEIGNGLSLGFGLSNICINQLYIQLSADFEISNPHIEYLNYHNFYDVILSLGYQFRILDFLSLTPTVGTGVVIQHTRLNIFYSPIINIGAMFDVNIIQNHHIFAAFDTSFLVYSYGEPLIRFQLGFLNHYQLIPAIPKKSTATIHINPPLFSPDGDDNNDLAEIQLKVTSYGTIDHWNLSILKNNTDIFYSLSGEGTVPDKIVWDGRSDTGDLVESETEYSVVFQLYDELNRNTTADGVILTDLLVFHELPKETQALIHITPSLFSPDNDNINDLAEIWLDITSYCEITEWTLTILDPQYHTFYSLSGEGEVPEKIVWDGHATNGDIVESAMEYYVYLELSDEYSRKTKVENVIKTDILVIKSADRLNMRIPVITFAPYATSLFVEDNEEKTEKNIEILNRLVELFTQYGDYTIRIEGHANHLDWDDPIKKQIEQETVLMPLSLKRAQVVKDSLVILGIEEDRLSVFGYGGDFPIVPFDDIDNRWKNRRVEFVLFKNVKAERE